MNFGIIALLTLLRLAVYCMTYQGDDTFYGRLFAVKRHPTIRGAERLQMYRNPRFEAQEPHTEVRRADCSSLNTNHRMNLFKIFVNNSASRISINSVLPPSFDPSVDDLIDILSNNNNNNGGQKNGPNLDDEGASNNEARHAAECDLLQRRVISSNDPISEQSLCPWSWTVDVKPRRIPGTIFRAKCRCEQVAPKIRPSPLTSNYECETVNMEIKVIEYEEGDATCAHPIEKLESVPVACVAIINRIYHVGRGSSANVETPNIEI